MTQPGVKGGGGHFPVTVLASLVVGSGLKLKTTEEEEAKDYYRKRKRRRPRRRRRHGLRKTTCLTHI